jgi:hypothetical protein
VRVTIPVAAPHDPTPEVAVEEATLEPAPASLS